jgi:hypothetical protein
MADELVAIQAQLDESYHDDKRLRDKLLMSCDVPEVRAVLKQRAPTD